MSDPTTRAAQRQALIDAGAIPAEATDDREPLNFGGDLGPLAGAIAGTKLSNYRPDVPARVRSAVYWATLGVAAAGLLASGLAGIWAPDIAPQVVATAGVASSVMGVIGGGVGVIYRPSSS